MTEKFAAKVVSDATRAGVKFVETMAKKAWSVIDAAAEKKSPNEVISPQAVKSIQGFTPEIEG